MNILVVILCLFINLYY